MLEQHPGDQVCYLKTLLCDLQPDSECKVFSLWQLMRLERNNKTQCRLGRKR